MNVEEEIRQINNKLAGLDYIQDSLNKIERYLFGNGQPALRERIIQVENRQSVVEKQCTTCKAVKTSATEASRSFRYTVLAGIIVATASALIALAVAMQAGG